MAKWIIIYCPDCKRRQHTPRLDGDPLKARCVIIRCPDCNGGDFDEPRYTDGRGNPIDALDTARAP